TLYESKGLEFNDVLLYNFFEDSTVDLSHWRVVLNAMPQDQRTNHPAPRFDEARHSGVCRELKFLYVAITRARKNLWIADSSEKGEPMRIVWTSKGQIQNCTPGTDVPQLAMSSTAEDWAKTALSLFNNRRYMQAMHCYERAGLDRERAVAHAYYLREVARSTHVTRGDTTAQATAFTHAADAFFISAKAAVKEKRAYYRIAAECYVHAGDDYKAGQAYSSATEYTLAAQHFRKAGKFEDAVNIVKAHKDKVTATVAESIVEVSRLYFLRERQLKKARELFDNDEEALEYMNDYGLDVVRASFLEDMGRYADAAEVHFAEGNTLEAIRLLTLDRANEESMRRASEYLLEGLWSHLSCGVTVTEEFLKTHSTIVTLLRLTDGLEDVSIDANVRNEVSMFRAIAKRETARLLSLGEKFITALNEPATFLCLDFTFSVPLKLQAASLSDIANIQQTFLAYARMLQKLSNVAKPCEDTLVRKIFALKPSTEDLFLLPAGSFLAAQCNGRLTPSARITDQGTQVPRWELERLIKHELKVRLLDRVNEEHRLCRELRPLQPCLAFAVFNQCNRTECPRNHADYQNYTAADYNVHVRVHLLQTLIYQTLYRAENPEELARQQRLWMRQLSEALFPAYYKLGSIDILAADTIPELEQALQIVRLWVHDMLYKLDPYISSHLFLSTFMRAVRLALVFDSKAMDYLYRTPSVAGCRPVPLLRGKDKAYVIHDLLAVLHLPSEDVSSLNRGLLFLNHVLENKLHIDITLLCDLMDHLCGSMVLAIRLQGSQGTLHDVTLPKSWLTRLLPKIESLRSKHRSLSFTYKKNLADLLEQIYSGVGAEYLLFEGRELPKIRHQIRNIFFARICKNLCLWGYNLRSWELRNDLTRAIGSVRQAGRSYSALIDEYVNARSWDSLARTVRHSVKGSVLDEMIQLRHGSKPVQKGSLPNVRRVVYSRLEDIPWLLKTAASNGAVDGLRAEAAAFVPTQLAMSAAQSEEDTAQLTTEDFKGDDELEQGVDVENVTQAIDAGQSIAAPVAATAEELAAAETILTVYRQYVARTRVRPKNTAEATRRRIFSAFSSEGQKMQWPHRYYRMLYLGPIPHLYIAVEHMKNHLHEARSVARKKFNVVQHLELESVQSSLTQMNRLFKEALKLHEELAPTAEIHKDRDLEKLKALTVQADALIKGLPAATTHGWEEDMKIGWRALVETKKTPAKQPLPVLNVEDLDE
ncbi:hypothetical protein C8Q80DRAFT_1134839, partial [Daedaleopsis nitida]